MVWTAALHLGAARAAADALDRVAGMIKKAVYRSSGRRVRGDDDKIPAIKTAASDLPLDVLRNMDKRVSIRGLQPIVHRRTPCECSRRTRTLAHRLRSRRKRPAHARTEWLTHQSQRRSELRGARPVPPDCRARLQCSTDFDTYVCGELEDCVKIAKHYSDDWHLSRPHRVGQLVRKALA